MAQYDGSIRINTQIDTRDVQKDVREIEKELARLKDAQKSFLDAGGSKGHTVYQGYEKEIINLQNALKALESTQEKVEVQPDTTNEHWNQLKIDVEEYAKSLKELQDEGKFFGDEDYDQVYLAWKNATDAVKAYQTELNKQTESGQAKAAEQAAKEAEKQEAAQRRIEEQAEKALQKENARIQKEAENEAKLQAKEAERQAKIEAEAAEEQRLAKIRENAVVGNQHIVESLERIKQLEQEISDLKKAGVTEGYEDYDKRIQELSTLKGEVKDYNTNIGKTKESYKKLGNTAKQSFEKINKSSKKSGGILSSFASRVKEIVASLLIFNQIGKVFKAMSSAIKEGLGNLYNENEQFRNSIDSLKASATTLKNAFAAAFKPLIEIAVPYIQKAIDYLTMLADKFAQFMAAVTGQRTYTKAIKQTTAALKDENKESNKQLSSLDKLNNFSSGGGGEDSGAGATMFEEVPVDGKLPTIFQQIAEYAEQLKNIFSQGFWDGLGDWEYRWESIKESIGTIKDSLVDIWTDPAVLSAADGYNKSIAYMLGSVAGSAASIGLTVATNLIGGISKYLEQNKDRIKDFVVNMFDIGEDINYLIADFSEAIAFVFEAFASEDAQQLTANIIGIFTDAIMGVVEIAGKLARDVLNIFIQPFVDNKEEFRTALEGFLSVLSEVTGTIKEGIDETFAKLNEVYDEHFKPFFDSIASGLSDTVGKFMEFWNGNVQPILDEWATKFDEVWKAHIQPALNKFAVLLGKVADLLKTVWENVLKPFIDWVIKNILPVLLPIFNGIGKAALSVFGTIGDVVSGILDALGGVIDFLTGVFSGDWEKAWNGIVDMFKGIFNLIPTIIEGIINTAIDIINGIIGGINVVATKVPGVPSIPEIKHVSIPRLATGTVVPPNREFLAVLGDNKREPEVVSPLSTMKQAVKEALSEAGGMGSNGEINLNLTVECEGYQLISLFQKLDKEYFKQHGKHVLA